VFPKLVINLAKLEHNAKVINQQIASLGGTMFAVTKVVGGDPNCARAVLAGGASGLADSRLRNIMRMKQAGIDSQFLLLRAPGLSEIEEVVSLADISLNSDKQVLQALNQEAGRQGRTHQVILMVDLGDGREGVLPEELEMLVNFTLSLDHLKIYGIGTNLACLGMAVPTVENMEALIDLYNRVNNGMIKYLSGCNSSSLHLVAAGSWHQGLRAVNHWRIGESIYFGWDILTKQPLPGCYQDVCRLEVEVIEVKRQAGRVILAAGSEEIGRGSIAPLDPGLTIVGISSDHIAADYQSGVNLEVGSAAAFTLDYQSLLAAANSPYVKVEFVNWLSKY
jgi:predicted amino acid racemase